MTPPADITLDCDDINETNDASAIIAAFLDGATATDNCDSDPVITYTGAMGIDICVGGVQTIEWTATDHCGLTATATATITILEDDVPPVVTPPADITLDCDDINETNDASAIIAAFLDGATATDNCDSDPVITYTGAMGIDICVGGVQTIEWTATDHCGLTATATATITILEDDVPPVVTPPADITLDCDDINETNDASAIIAAFLDGATATDNCDPDVVPVLTENITPGSYVNRYLYRWCTDHRIWTVTDNCGLTVR